MCVEQFILEGFKTGDKVNGFLAVTVIKIGVGKVC